MDGWPDGWPDGWTEGATTVHGGKVVLEFLQRGQVEEAEAEHGEDEELPKVHLTIVLYQMADKLKLFLIGEGVVVFLLLMLLLVIFDFLLLLR